MFDVVLTLLDQQTGWVNAKKLISDPELTDKLLAFDLNGTKNETMLKVE